MVRKKGVCFREGKQLLGDKGLHSFRDDTSDFNRGIVRSVRTVTFCGDRENFRGDFKRKGKYQVCRKV